MKFLILFFLAQSLSAAPATREWQPITSADYWADVGLALTAFTAYTLVEKQSGKIGQANFIDDAGRSALRLSSSGQRHDAEVLSNSLLAATIALPVALDPYLVWGRDGNSKSAARIWNINAQAFALTAILTGTTKAIIGRERPYVSECRRNPQHNSGCKDSESDEALKSFYSGHSVYAYTAAGLTCLHHTELHLYGDERDAFVCGTAIGLASAVALMRVGADKHYVTDVSAGAIIGLLSGYIVPRWFHNSQPSIEAQSFHALWLPMISADNTYGLTSLIYF